MKEFFEEVEKKYVLEDFTGYIGTLLDEHAEEEDIEKSLEFLQDIYSIAEKLLR